MASPKMQTRLKEHGFPDIDQTLFLVDVSSFIFRAFFAIRQLSNKKGEPTNAVYGVATMLSRLLEDARPKYLSIVYDSKEPSFRKDVYSEYKANRSAPPDDLVPQFDRIEDLIKRFELHSVRESGIEADDLIGTLTKKWLEENSAHRVVIVTGDKDLMQLVNDRVVAWDTMKDQIFGPKEVEEKFQVKPDQVRDYLALVGDSSDNIPGVPSIGPKSAVDLLNQFGDLPGILKAAKDGKITGKKGDTLRDHEADALLSQQLATLKMDCDVHVHFEKMQSPFQSDQFRVTENCLELLRELDLNSLVTKWGGAIAASTDDPLPLSSTAQSLAQPIQLHSALKVGPDTFRCVSTEEQFVGLLRELDRAPEFGFDLETTSLNPRKAEIVGIAIAPGLTHAYYIPVGHRGTDVPQLPLKYVLEKLKPYIENPKHKKIGQNLKYDFSVLLEQGLTPDGIGADTMVADYILEPEGRHSLEILAMKYFDYPVKTYESLCGKGKDQIGFDLVPVDQATRYSAEDAWVALHLWHRMKPLLQEKGLMRVFAEVDLPLVQVLARMECAGVTVDVDWLKKLSTEFSREIQAIDEKIQKFAKHPVNINSPKQLAQLLFEELKLPTQTKTKTGFSTDASVLEILAPMHEIPALILQHREIAKLMGTYVETLPGQRDPKTGKIHAGFHQTVAATGRLSSSDPNLQNIPVRTQRGQMIRRAFIASPGNVLISADYSQIELRLLAQMSGDKDLMDSFLKDEDVHQRTASEIYGIQPEAVTPEQRGVAKAINFGLMYGKTAFGLAQELDISRTEAKEMIDRYFTRYRGVKDFLDRQVLEAKERGWVVTMLGRRRDLPELQSKNPMMRANAERMAMNTPIQGTAADLMKLAMIRLDEALSAKKMKAKMIIQVHDEVVIDCPVDELDAVKKIVTESMEKAFDGIVEMKVPLKVNVESGQNWMDL
jgi:DNA polymerase-1